MNCYGAAPLFGGFGFGSSFVDGSGRRWLQQMEKKKSKTNKLFSLIISNLLYSSVWEYKYNSFN